VNRTLPTQPGSTPETLVFGSPPWFVVGFRSVLFFVGCITAVLCAQNWSAMPLFARFLGALIAPTLVGWSVWPRPWRCTTKFIANENGMYFPAYRSLTFSMSEPQIEEAWLEVPWKHIADIRVATEAGEDGSCAAFDIQASPSERSRFFGSVGVPRDRSEQLSATVSAAFGGWSPSPVRVVQKLQDLSSRSAV
jgi:hypothetical protein